MEFAVARFVVAGFSIARFAVAKFAALVNFKFTRFAKFESFASFAVCGVSGCEVAVARFTIARFAVADENNRLVVSLAGQTSADFLQFNVPPPSAEEELLGAELSVHVATVASARRVRVYRVLANLTELLDTIHSSADENSVVFNVTAAAVGQPSLTLQLTEETSEGRWRPLNVIRRGQECKKQPVLVFYIRENNTIIEGKAWCYS